LPDVLGNINNFNANSTIKIEDGANLVVNLTAELPQITTPLSIVGNNNLTIDGAALAGPTPGLVFATDGISVSGVTLQNFSGGPGIDLQSTKNSAVTDVTVLNSLIGIRATGELSGTVVSGSTFQNNTEGGRLSAASNLSLGLSNAQPNRFLDSKTYGLSIAGVNGGTTVYGNTFTNNPTAISLASAQGTSTNPLLIGSASGYGTFSNTVSQSSVAVFATGFCTYTQVNYMLFGSGVTTLYDIGSSRNLDVNP